MKCLYSLISLAVFAAPSVIGEVVTCYNTFQDAGITGFSATIFDEREATVSDDVEFIAFPKHPTDPTKGFYDIDIVYDDATMMGTITFDLKDGSGATHAELTEGSYDRYYFVFEEENSWVEVSQADELNPKVYIPFYEDIELLDAFSSGIVLPTLDNTVIVVEMSPGTNMTLDNVTATISFKREPVDKIGNFIAALLALFSL